MRSTGTAPLVRDPDAGPAGDGQPEPTDDQPDGGAKIHWTRPSIDSLVALALILVGLLIGLAPLYDNSFMTHLATGRIILDTGSIPSADPYSFTAPGAPWTVQSWGASVIYAGAENLFGLAGIRAIVAACTATLAWLVWRLTRPAGSLLGRLVPAAIVVGAGASVWVERPLLFGLLCLGAVIAAGEGELDPRWLIPVMWIWVNAHGSFPLGLAALGMVMVGRWMDKESPRVEARALAWAVGGTVLAAVNPIGPKLLVFPLRLLSNRDAFAGTAEWGPPSWHTPGEWFFAVQVVLAIVVLLVGGRRWRVALPLVVFTLASLMSVRNMAPASLVLLPGMALSLRGLGSIDGTKRPAMARPLAAVLVALALLLTATSLTSGTNTNLVDYPVAPSNWMVQNGLLDRDDRVVSRDFVGNYWEYRFGPDQVRVFMDDRVDMYPIGVIDDYTSLLHADGDFGGVLRRAKATAVLWDRDSDFGRWLEDTPSWRVVHRDTDWLVAVPV